MRQGFAAGVGLAAALALAGSAEAASIFGNAGLNNGSRWDAATRIISGRERSLAGGLRFSVEGGSYQSFRDMFTWAGAAPSVATFEQAVLDAFNAWTVADPASGLGSDLSFTPSFATPVQGPSATGKVNIAGAEIDLLAYDDAFTWNPGNSGLRGEAFFNTTGFTNLTLTSGTTAYPGFAISGADVKLNSNPQAQWTLDWFRLVLTHEIGHALGLGDVDELGPEGKFLDDNFDGSDSNTALNTLTNAWAGLVNPTNPAASPLSFFTVADANPGVDTLGVNILMESNIPPALLGDLTPLQNDDFGGRQFLYPFVPAVILLGDANNDQQVTGADLIAVQQAFGAIGPADGLLQGDANDDGQVTGADLIAVQQNFGNALSPANPTVPEPTTLATFAAALPLLLRRRGG